MVSPLFRFFVLLFFVVFLFKSNAQIPTINAISLNEAVQNSTISISGVDLIDIVGISIGQIEFDINQVYTITSGVLISATLPSIAVGSYFVVVTTSGGFSNSLPITITSAPVILPTITGINRLVAEVDDEIIISGLALGTITAVSFGSIEANFATFSQIDANTFSIKIPKVPQVSSYHISITNAAGASNFLSLSVSGLNNPQISSISSSRSNSGQYITISGTNFESISGIYFGNTVQSLSELKVIDINQVEVKVPSLSIGSHNISLENSFGRSTEFLFSVTNPKPTISAISSLVVLSGDKFTVSGANFSAPIYAIVGSLTMTGVRLISTSQVEITASNGSITGFLEIITSFGRATSTDQLTISDKLGERGTFTGIGLAQELALDLFPNPTSTFFILKSNLELEIALIDQLGNTLFTASTNQHINIEHLKSGLYFIGFKTNQHLFTKKLLIE